MEETVITMLRVENLTQNSVLVQKGRVADTAWQRFKGLMGVRHLPEGDGLLIEPCDSIHTHFMRIAIDVVYMDKSHRVVHVDPAMKPWRIGRRHSTAHYVLEIPSGAAAKSKTTVGDHLKLVVN